ncbi:MAG: DNA polymerase III subunit delta [Acetobacteraceae bacterium]|nr:DNA polymerase III subunit delta [Acetobacteraceae bacterium]
MKIDPRRVGAFLRDPGTARLVLLYGDDAGLIRERAETLVRSVAGTVEDPFRVADLDRPAPDQLMAEAIALSLTGGRRVVRVREAGDGFGGFAKEFLASKGSSLVVLEAPGLAARSRLRSLAEAAPDAAAIGCYPEEGRALADTISAVLVEFRIGIDKEAREWLIHHLGADRDLTRQELVKLALYTGQGGQISIEEATACVGDLAGLSIDDALFAMTAGDLETTDRALELALAEGASAVGILRAGIFHMERLHLARLAIDGGTRPDDAIRALRPPIFFRRMTPFKRALGLWESLGLWHALVQFGEAERACKRTGAPAEAICRQAIFSCAARAGGSS